jgi:uncharacterized protein (DUF433 family)
MSSPPPPLRLSARTTQLLERRADELRQSPDTVADRLLGEALRTERHPLITFRQNADGHRRPALAGTRLYVWQMIDALRTEEHTAAVIADGLDLAEELVHAAVRYRADFPDEVDRDRQDAADAARLERARRHGPGALPG